MDNTSVPNGRLDDPDDNGLVPLEAILCTGELQRRPSRPPDYEKQNRALVALSQALADSPRTVLQTLVDTILDVCRAGSSGISLLTKDDDGKRFYWPAIAGQWKQHIGGGTPRDFGPCGDVLDRNAALLMHHVERRYAYFTVKPALQEALLVPFYVQGKAVGTIWAVAHDDRKFEAEDERLMKSLGQFASSAYQMLESLDALQLQAAEAVKSEEEIRTFAQELETQVSLRTQELQERNAHVIEQAEDLRELSRRLLVTQDDERRRIARDLHDSVGQIVTALSIHLVTIAQGAVKPEVRKAADDGREMLHQLSKEIRTVSYLLHPPLLDETGLAEAVRWYMRGVAERSGLKIDLEIPEDFGRLPEDVEVAIFRIVQECLTNIHRHSGGKTATIRLSRDMSNVSLEVQDNGRGIPKDALSAIQSRRSGVGMTGMRERVRHLGGTLDLQSTSTGTKVAVTFPTVADAMTRAAGTEKTRTAEYLPQSQMDILIVDDNTMIRRSVAALLAKCPEFKVCGEASNGDEAIVRAKALRPKLILLDISMPGANGLEVSAVLRRELPMSKIVIMSQHDEAQLLPRAMEAGADACVDKNRLAMDLLLVIKRLTRTPGALEAANCG